MPPIPTSNVSENTVLVVPLSATARTRMVSFRLTKEQHERYHKICLGLGISGFSELVRIAIDKFVERAALTLPSGDVESRLSEIESCLRTLTGEVKRLNHEQSPSTDKQTRSTVSPLTATGTNS